MKYERLSHDEERALFNQRHIESVRDEIIERYMGLVHAVVARMTDYGSLTYDDLVQEGYMELIRLVDRYEDKENRFSTYVYKSLPFRLMKYVESTRNIITLNQGPISAKKKVLKAQHDFIERMQRSASHNDFLKSPEFADALEKTGLRKETLISLLETAYPHKSLDEEIMGLDRIETLVESVPDRQHDFVDILEKRDVIDSILKPLNNTERDLLFKVREGVHFDVLAAEAGITRQGIYYRVDVIRKKVIDHVSRNRELSEIITDMGYQL